MVIFWKTNTAAKLPKFPGNYDIFSMFGTGAVANGPTYCSIASETVPGAHPVLPEKHNLPAGNAFDGISAGRAFCAWTFRTDRAGLRSNRPHGSRRLPGHNR